MIRFKFQACRAAQRELWDYTGERLAEGPMEQVEQHLETCASCRREATDWKKAQHLLETAQAASLPTAQLGWMDLQARIAADVAAFGPPRPDKRHTRQAVAQLIPTRRAQGVSALRPALIGGIALTLTFALFANRAPRISEKTPTAGAPITAVTPVAPLSPPTAPVGYSPLFGYSSEAYPNPIAAAPTDGNTKSSQQIAQPDPVKVRPAQNRIAPAPAPRLKLQTLKIAAKPAPFKGKAAKYLSDSQTNDKIKFQPHEPTSEEKPLDNTEVAAGVIGTLVPVSNDDSNGYY